MKLYYTYAYLREDKTPYYIGKGKKKYKKYYTRITASHGSIKVPPRERIIILKEFENEFHAYKHEIYMIKVFGRKDLGTGILHNKTDGGEGFSNTTEEARKRSSKIHKGKILSKETKRKIAETRKKRGYKCSEDLKLKYSDMYSGKGNPNYGKKHSPETLSKISAVTKNKNLKVRWYVSPEGEAVEVKNLREFCETNNLNYNSMISVHNDKCYSHKGYTKYNSKIIKTNHWIGRKHTDDTKKIQKERKIKYIYTLVDPKGNIHHTKYLMDLCKIHNLNDVYIRSICRGKGTYHKGWTATRELIIKKENNE